MHRPMQKTSMVLAVAILAIASMNAHGQQVTYQFTGTPHPDYGYYNTSGIGSVITGEITLDVGATPDYCQNYPGYYNYAYWEDGNFAIDGMTDSGVMAGTNTNAGGTTQFYSIEYDPSYYLWHYDYIYHYNYDGNVYTEIYLHSGDNSVGDGDVCNVPDPWEPANNPVENVYVWIYQYDDSTGQTEYGYFSIDSFTSDSDGDGIPDNLDACPNSDLSPTVVIDGCDSGVENDLLDDGCTISDLIANCAANSTSHGEFVSCVAHLTNQLKKDGVITGKEKGAIQSCAAKSDMY